MKTRMGTKNAIGVRKVLFVTMVAITIVWSASPAFAKSYSYDYINITLQFSPDGSVIVQQERAYDFQGSFSYAYLDLLKKGADDIDFLEIRDLDTGSLVQFDLDEDSRHAKATWYYSAQDEVKRFLITYRIDEAVKRYADVAEFYWEVIEGEHERVDNFYATVQLPSSSAGLFKVFVHGIGEGELTFSDDLSTAYVKTGIVPKDRLVEFRVLTEPDIFSDVQKVESEMYQRILNEEKAIFSSSSTRQATAILLTNQAFWILVLAVPTVVFIFFYMKYGKEPRVDYDMHYEHEPPSDIPPMALANLMEGEESELDITIEAKGVLATLFDLAVRGYLKIEEKEGKRVFGLSKKTEQVFVLTKKGKSGKGLLNFEKDVIRFIFGCGSEPDKVTSSEIANYSRWHSHGVRNTIKKIDRKARAWFERKFYKIADKKSSKMANMFRVFIIAYGVLLAAIAVFTSLFVFIIIPIVFSAIFLIASLSITKRTYESALEMKKWKAFRRLMKDFSAMKDAPKELLYLWDRYLVYAVVLGVAKELLKNVGDLVVYKNISMHPVVWYHGVAPHPRGVMSPQTFSTLSSNISTMVSSLSSSTSIGGGFSAAAGGGAGGGGASGAG